jgi:membrane protein YqaA with SNARE-associated domain
MIRAALLACGVGVVSALFPVVNAEAVLVGSSALQAPLVVAAVVVAMSLGQTGGKLLIFAGSRRGVTRWRARRTGSPVRTPTWVRRANAKLLHWLSHPVGGPAAVALSATVGLPPLAVVSASAGVSSLRSLAFCLACFTGRLVRFATLAGSVSVLVQ